MLLRDRYRGAYTCLDNIGESDVDAHGNGRFDRVIASLGELTTALGVLALAVL